jgi:hypothetical protein
VVTAVFATVMGPQPITPATHALLVRGMHIVLLIFSASCLLGVFASLARGSGPRAEQAPAG